MAAALIAFYAALCLPGIGLAGWLFRGGPLDEWKPVPYPTFADVPDSTFDHRGLV